MKAPETYLATAVAFPANHGTGELKLLSSDPDAHPLIDPKFLTYPFDKRIAIESIREILEFLGKPRMAKNSVRLASRPSGKTDEDIMVRRIVQQATNSTSYTDKYIPFTLADGIVAYRPMCRRPR